MRKRIASRDEKIIIGRFPDVSVLNARKKTLEIKTQIVTGVNPNESKRSVRRDVTFGEFFDDLIERHSKRNKVTWRQDVRAIHRLCPQSAYKKDAICAAQRIAAATRGSRKG